MNSTKDKEGSMILGQLAIEEVDTKESRWPCFGEWASAVKEWYHDLLRALGKRLINRSPMSVEQMVLKLVCSTANLEMTKDQFVELAPVEGCMSSFRLSGTALPVFEYTVFEKHEIRVADMDVPTRMEFIRVRVEVALPDQIRFISTIESTTAPEFHGKVIETLDEYKKPFQILALSLCEYFPFTRGAVQ